MNLGKLLGAGKSFVSWRGDKSYRQNRHVTLPKFNTGKNPFLPVTEAATPSAEAKAALVQAQAVAVAVAVAAPKPAARPVRTTTWTHKLNPFRAPTPVAPPTYRAEQCELSLEAVKPVSNDLEEADIEVVPAKSRTIMQVEQAELMEVPMLTPAREPWEFVGERMMKPV